ncbi:MAG: type II secretion system protein [Eubacteriales bacterium]|nr:type II secretion system protein [Eubacteriales bacterium]
MFGKRMMSKLKSRKGETLVEALIAVLIIALASFVLLGSVMSAYKINKTVKASDVQFKAMVQAAEQEHASLNEDKSKLTVGDKSFDISLTEW